MNEEILYRIRVIDEASKQIKKIETSLRQLGNGSIIAGFKANIDNVNKSLISTADKMQGIGLKSSIALGITTKKLYDFEKQMNIISAVSGKSQQELEGFRKKTIELGASTQYTTTQVAELGVVFARAGFSIDETTNLLADSLNMASAGAISLEDSASLMANTIKSFGLEIEDATRITDIFSKGANISNMTMLDFNEMISKTGAVAVKSNISLEEMSAMFGVLKDSGFEASIASTGLASSIMRMSSRTSEVRKSLRGMGIDAEAFIKLPFQKRLEILASKNMDLAGATQLFGMEHAKTMLTLIGNLDKLKIKQDQIKNSAGTAQKSQQAMMQGLVGSFERFRSALDGVIFGVGEGGLTGKLTKLFDILTKVIDKFNNASPVIKNWVGNLLILGSTLLGISVLLRTMAFLLGGTKILFGIVSIATTLWASKLVVLNGVLAILRTGIILLQLAFSPLMLIILAIAMGVVALILALHKAYSIIQKIRNPNQVKEQKEPDFIDKALSKMMDFANAGFPKPTGELKINVESKNNEKVETEILKQSGLKIGVQN